jgi:NADH-quinone oxidoreductase subunit J
MLSPLVFGVFAGISTICSLFVVFGKRPVTSAFSLVLVFFAFAGIYAGLDAHLIAALQVLVYAGAIMVLFVFVIMLLNADTPSLDLKRVTPTAKTLIGLMSVGLWLAFVWMFKTGTITGQKGSFSAEQIQAAGGNTQVLAQLMFSKYILPFELTSVLLLAAIVGTVAIAKRNPGQNPHHSSAQNKEQR